MIIMRIKGFDMEIKIQEDIPTVLNILDKKLFRSVILSIQNNIQGYENNDIVIEKNNSIIDCSKEAELIIDYFNLDINMKKITQILYKYIEDEISFDTEIHYELEQNLISIGSLLNEASSGLEFKLDYDNNLSILSLLKMYDFKINADEYPSTVDKLYLMLDLFDQFKIDKILIFINIKCYFSLEEIKELYKYLVYKKIMFVCINSEECDNIGMENQYLIDEDLVEIVHSDNTFR